MNIYNLLILLIIILTIKAVTDHHRDEKKRESDLLAKHGLDPDSMKNTLDTVQQMRVQNARPVMAMTTMYLPRIIEDFPDFNFEEMRERAEVVLVSYLRAIDQNDISLFKYGSKQLEDVLRSKIEMNIDAGCEENYDLIKVNRTEIAKYLKSAGRYVIVMQSSIECLHYILKEGELIDGSRDQKYQTRFEMELAYVQDAKIVDEHGDKTMAVNCPNCGAPVRSIANKFCEYCGSSLIDLNLKKFSFISITEK